MHLVVNFSLQLLAHLMVLLMVHLLICLMVDVMVHVMVHGEHYFATEGPFDGIRISCGHKTCAAMKKKPFFE